MTECCLAFNCRSKTSKPHRMYDTRTTTGNLLTARHRDALGGLIMVAVAVLFTATLVSVKLSNATNVFWLGAWMRLGIALIAGLTVALF